MKRLTAFSVAPSRAMFDAMAEPGCYFLVPQQYRGLLQSFMDYEHGYQFVFDPRVTKIFLKDSVTDETKGVIEGLAITGPVANMEEI